MSPFKELLEKLGRDDVNPDIHLLNHACREAHSGLRAVGALFEKCKDLDENPLSREVAEDIGSLIRGLSDIAEYCRQEAELDHHALKKKLST